MLPKDPRRFFKFCLVGGSGVVVNMSVFALVRNMASGPPSLLLENTAVVLGFLVSCFTNFLLNDGWTWRDRKRKASLSFLQRLVAYFLVALVAFATQLAAFNILLWLLPASEWTPYLANLIGIGFATIINFVLNNVWTFRVTEGGGLTLIMLRTWRQQTRNMSAGVSPLWAIIAVALVIIAGLALYGAGASSWYSWERESTLDPGARAVAFWFSIVHVLVFAYTTFELLYRSADTRVLTAYPTAPRSWYALIQIKAWVYHAPLLLPGLIFSLPLLTMGRGDLFTYIALYFFAVFLLGIPLSLALHLLAGKTILQGESAAKNMLSGGLVSAESAYLFFSPAAAFGAILSAAVLFEFALRFYFERGQALPLLVGICATAGIAFWGWWRGRQIFEESFASILPRFRESEVVAPFEEKDLPLRVFGLGCRRWLPSRASALFTRDLLQLRRRYRLGGVGIVIFTIVLALFGARASSTDSLWMGILLMTGCVGIAVFNPTFRLLGSEIERAPLRGALPIRPADRRLARILIVCLSTLPAVLIAMGMAFLFSAPWQGILLIGLIGSTGIIGVSLFTLWCAEKVFPRIAPLAWTTRLCALSLLAGVQAIWHVF